METPTQRLLFTTVLAVGVHSAVILGIRFSTPAQPPPPLVLSLNLALEEKVSGGTGAAPRAAAPGAPALPALAAQAQPVPPVETSTPAPAAEPAQALAELPPAELAPPPVSSDAPTAAANLSLMPLAKTSTDALSSPREKRIDDEDASTLSGFYAERWRLWVEKIGSQHFPAKAREQKLVGRLTLDVAIRADGSVASIAMLRSSGYPLLDRAARQIVYLAAPFEPFSEELRRQYDVLHIVRTWEFDQDNRLRSSH